MLSDTQAITINKIYVKNKISQSEKSNQVCSPCLGCGRSCSILVDADYAQDWRGNKPAPQPARGSHYPWPWVESKALTPALTG